MEELNEKILKLGIELDDIYDTLNYPSETDTEEFLCTLKKRAEEIKQELDILEKQLNKKICEGLWAFKKKPEYNQCYDGILEHMTFALNLQNIYIEEEDVLNVFLEAEKQVVDCLNSPFPEIYIFKCLNRIQRGTIRYMFHFSGPCVYSAIRCLFIIVLWDSIPEKSSSIINTFHNARLNIYEYMSKNNVSHGILWNMVCERIPDEDSNDIGDIIAQNNHLLEKIKELEHERDMAQDGWVKEDGEFKPSQTRKRIAVLQKALNLPIPLANDEREQFIKLCSDIFKVTKGTLDNYLSQGRLYEGKDLFDTMKEEYPILKRLEQ